MQLRPLLVAALLSATAFLYSCETPGRGSITIDGVIPTGDYQPGIGLTFAKFIPESIGGWGSLKGSITDKEPHYDSLSPGAFGDPQTDSYFTFFTASGGVTYGLGENVGLYAGVGFGVEQEVIEQYDPMRILASDGYYYVDGEDSSAVNAAIGVMAWTDGGFTVHLGFDSMPEAVTVGIGFSF